MNLDILTELAQHTCIDLVRFLQPALTFGKVSDLPRIDHRDVDANDSLATGSRKSGFADAGVCKRATISAERLPNGRHSESTEKQSKLSNSDILGRARPFRPM